MTIVLTYTDYNGTQQQVEYKDDVVEINLRSSWIARIDLTPLATCTSHLRLNLGENYLQSLDLTPLATCTSLQQLYLGYNQLQSIDLTPLATCTSLHKLFLGHNQLQSLDLSPLSTCTDLEGFYLGDNELQSIDLTPLASCITFLRRLDLGRNQFQSLDLSPIGACSNLRYLNLSKNQFQSIDLTPLATCTSLEELWLDENQLQSIDLTPLSTVTSLKRLILSSNKLQSLDLTPLATCTSLEELWLGYNQLQSIDLTPLVTCTGLKRFFMQGNQLKSLDLTPLATCTRLKELELEENQLQSFDTIQSWLRQKEATYRRPVNSYPWSFLYRIADQFGTDRRVQQDLLYAMGLKDYGFIDYDLYDLFLSITADTPIEIAREQVSKGLLEEITRIIDDGRATTGLNVEELSAHHAELAKRMQRIIQLREVEIQQVIVGLRDTEVDLRELLLTSYGYEVMIALCVRPTTDLEGLEKVKKALSEMGFELKIGKTSDSGVEVNEELKQVIWWIAENRGRRWREITKEERGEKS